MKKPCYSDSQILSIIKELSPQTIIKLANFFGVDPTEIDPNISDSLPNIKQLEVRFNFEDSTTPLKHITGSSGDSYFNST